jgi:hypothetical protein
MPYRPHNLLVEPLEPRLVLSAVYPTNYEQYLVELINRGRANPAAEADRYGVSLNEGVPSNQTISTAAKQPLAINPFLTDGAREHSQWMIDNDVFSHTGANGTAPNQRMISAGYTFRAPYTWGENIAWRSFSGSSADYSLVAQLHEDLFVDAGIADRGHRTNLMNPNFREIGSGFVTGGFSRYNAGMLTTDFATTNGNPFLTGVIYNDSVKDDDFYTPGEGLSGVTITARRASDNAVFSTTSWSSGGYTLQLPAGSYAVIASGGSLAQPLTSDVTVWAENVKVDFVPGVTAVTADHTPPAAALTRAKRNRIVQRYYPFLVTYTDAEGVNTGTLDNYDIMVTGPGGYARMAAFNFAYPHTDDKAITAFYSVKGPGGSWDQAENGGTFTISLRKRQVYDTTGNAVPSTVLGTFGVSVPTVSTTAIAPSTATTTATKRETSALLA